MEPVRRLWQETCEWRRRFPSLVDATPFSEVSYSEVEAFLERWWKEFTRFQDEGGRLPPAAAAVVVTRLR